MRVRRMYCEYFKVFVYLYVGRASVVERKILRGFGEKVSLAATDGHAIYLPQKDGGAHFILYLASKRNSNTLVHETNHLASFILADRGIKIKSSNDEIHTYYQEYWFKRISELLRSC